MTVRLLNSLSTSPKALIPDMPIHFFSEDISFQLDNEPQTTTWIDKIIDRENRLLGDLNFIFCSDTHLHNINLSYLDHDTYTDIITFDNSEAVENITGDIFISIDRVKENAEQMNVRFNEELHRVMIHGVLHLIGYKDKSSEEKAKMREKEDACLSLR